MKLGLTADIAEYAACLSMRNPVFRIYPYAPHKGHVHHQRPIGSTQPGDVMPSTFNTEQQIVFAGKFYSSNHVGSAQAAHNDSRFFVNHRVPNGTTLFITVVFREENGSTRRFIFRLSKASDFRSTS